MRSSALDSLPARLRRCLTKLGRDIAIARRKRNLTATMMAERIGSAKIAYLKVKKGDPSVLFDVYRIILGSTGVCKLHKRVLMNKTENRKK